jgi:hypothetical protein
MSMVRFAMLCDRCGARSEEYVPWPSCQLCMDDVCHHCIVHGSLNEESNKALCTKCCSDITP